MSQSLLKISKWKAVRFIKNTPGIHLLYRWYTEIKIGKSHADKPIEEVFSSIFKNNSWNNTESISGPGSANIQTAEIVSRLPELIQKLNIHTLLDAPCGDFNWMRKVDLSNLTYIGGDIVNELITFNQKEFSTANLTFIVLDITKDKLPEADAILVRDCLVHLSYQDIKLFFQNLKTSKIRYLITTSFPKSRYNYNIKTGNWRPINLEKKPFQFPAPKDAILEKCTEGYGQFPDKSLLVWEIKSLPI